MFATTWGSGSRRRIGPSRRSCAPAPTRPARPFPLSSCEPIAGSRPGSIPTTTRGRTIRRGSAPTDSATALAKWASGAKGSPSSSSSTSTSPHCSLLAAGALQDPVRLVPYDGEIAAADAAVGSFVGFLKSAGLYDRAILIFLSDHGEGLGDHGEAEHGVFLYREALRVPLLVKRAGKTGTSVTAPVSLTDVVPTVLSLLSIPIPNELPACSLLAPESRGERRIYSGPSIRGWLSVGRSRLACGGSVTTTSMRRAPKLYDLASDPAERRILLRGCPPSLRSDAVRAPGDRPALLAARGLYPRRVRSWQPWAHQRFARPAGRRLAARPERQSRSACRAQEALRSLLRRKVRGRRRPGSRLRCQEPRVLSAWTMLSDSLDHCPGCLKRSKPSGEESTSRRRSRRASSSRRRTPVFPFQKRAGDTAGAGANASRGDRPGLRDRGDQARARASLPGVGEDPGGRGPAEGVSAAPEESSRSSVSRSPRLEGARRPGELFSPRSRSSPAMRASCSIWGRFFFAGGSVGARDWFSKSLEADPSAVQAHSPGWASSGEARRPGRRPVLPTVADAGNLPVYQSAATAGVFARSAPTIIKRLNEEINRVLGRPEVKERFFNQSLEILGAPGNTALQNPNMDNTPKKQKKSQPPHPMKESTDSSPSVP